ncbi:MAG: hypothetical protein ACPG54_00015 [Bizionia paragorgiae]|uniref:hypothetical protein n=1 Tax=Bizionia paragorgiae TaxID=283786 RepID=UPI003C654EE0
MVSAIASKITAFVLVFILLAHNINTLAIVGDFVINQDFIAKTLCIQKKDQQGCNGKCQLRKELVESQSSTNTETPLQVSKRLVLDAFFASSIVNIHVEQMEWPLQKQKTHFHSSKVLKLYPEIDTPPPNFSSFFSI